MKNRVEKKISFLRESSLKIYRACLKSADSELEVIEQNVSIFKGFIFKQIQFEYV